MGNREDLPDTRNRLMENENITEKGLLNPLEQLNAPKMRTGCVMKLSRTVAYAVRATLQLATSETSEPVPCSQLAATGQMPERFLLQILRNLVTHGILRSTRGVDGGYSLVRPADQISLLQVIEAIEGPFETEGSLDEAMPESTEKLQQALENVTETTRNQLEAIKLSQLLPPPVKNGNGK